MVAEEDEGRFAPGTIVAGRYRILSMLGKGGMGEVYRATDLTLAQSVALKFLPEEAARNERWLERFHSEVRIARQISHPNICRVYDIGESDGMPFISMEYVAGDDLSTLLGSIGRLPPDKALETARKLCAGLAAAHDKGVIHRDLKPQNIMISKRGEIVIMDFGLAAVADSLGGAEARNGTPAYMAPEQLRGAEVTAKSDIYALGLVLYEIFTGKKPFDAKTIPELIQLQESHSSMTMTSVAADIDPAVEKIIRRCLHPDPAMRPTSPLAIAAALPGGDPLAAALAAGETISPELLAKSGKREAIALKYTMPCLAVVALALIAMPFVGQKVNAVNYASVSMPPEVLAQKARDNAALLGYTDRPADTRYTFESQAGYSKWLDANKKGKTTDWSAIFHGESPIVLRYRQSPRLLIATPDGQVRDQRPPQNITGMWSMEVDAHGLLRRFEAVPPEFVEKAEAKPFDAEPVFRAAGFDISKFSETTPQWTPASGYDARRAWKGKHPNLQEIPLTVEIAAFQGKVVQALIVWPWTKPERTQPPQTTTGKTAGSIIQIGALILGLGFCLWLAGRNIRLGRGDRKGATTIAIVFVVLQVAQFPGGIHWVPDAPSWGFFMNKLGGTVFSAGLCWLLYVALEPIIRAQWPHSIVTWSRALTGQFSDPALGSHILYGCVAGVLITSTFVGIGLYQMFSGESPGSTSFSPAMGTFSWIQVSAGNLVDAMTSGMTIMFGLFGLRKICRTDWLTAMVAAGLLTLQQLVNGNGDFPFKEFFWYAIYCGLIFCLIRFGIVVAVVGMFTANILLNNAACLDPQIWYAPPAYLQLLMIGSIALFGFLKSRGDGNPDPLQ